MVKGSDTNISHCSSCCVWCEKDDTEILTIAHLCKPSKSKEIHFFIGNILALVCKIVWVCSKL